MNWRTKFIVTKRWVVNASPLILLGKTENLNLLGGLADIVAVPRAVINEVSAKPDGASTIQAIVGRAPYRIVNNEDVSPDLLIWGLGAGETQVIANAQRHGANRVVIDDLKARRCAQAMGFKVIGTLGVVGRAKASGLNTATSQVVTN